MSVQRIANQSGSVQKTTTFSLVKPTARPSSSTTAVVSTAASKAKGKTEERNRLGNAVHLYKGWSVSGDKYIFNGDNRKGWEAAIAASVYSITRPDDVQQYVSGSTGPFWKTSISSVPKIFLDFVQRKATCCTFETVEIPIPGAVISNSSLQTLVDTMVSSNAPKGIGGGMSGYSSLHAELDNFWDYLAYTSMNKLPIIISPAAKSKFSYSASGLKVECWDKGAGSVVYVESLDDARLVLEKGSTPFWPYGEGATYFVGLKGLYPVTSVNFRHRFSAEAINAFNSAALVVLYKLGYIPLVDGYFVQDLRTKNNKVPKLAMGRNYFSSVTKTNTDTTRRYVCVHDNDFDSCVSSTDLTADGVFNGEVVYSVECKPVQEGFLNQVTCVKCSKTFFCSEAFFVSKCYEKVVAPVVAAPTLPSYLDAIKSAGIAVDVLPAVKPLPSVRDLIGAKSSSSTSSSSSSSASVPKPSTFVDTSYNSVWSDLAKGYLKQTVFSLDGLQTGQLMDDKWVQGNAFTCVPPERYTLPSNVVIAARKVSRRTNLKCFFEEVQSSDGIVAIEPFIVDNAPKALLRSSIDIEPFGTRFPKGKFRVTVPLSASSSDAVRFVVQWDGATFVILGPDGYIRVGTSGDCPILAVISIFYFSNDRLVSNSAEEVQAEDTTEEEGGAGEEAAAPDIVPEAEDDQDEKQKEPDIDKSPE